MRSSDYYSAVISFQSSRALLEGALAFLCIPPPHEVKYEGLSTGTELKLDKVINGRLFQQEKQGLVRGATGFSSMSAFKRGS